MSIQSRISKGRERRAIRVRAKLKSHGAQVRVSIFRSLTNFYAQIIDDQQGKTLAACSTLELSNIAGDKTAKAKAVGLELAKRAREKGISVVAFDRGRFLYHGRVKAFAEGLREGGVTL